VLSASFRDDKVTWYRNGDSSGGGNGSSWTRTDITTSATEAKSVYAADIDEDGDTDVLSASEGDDTIAWYKNGDSSGGGDGSSWTRTDITTSADAAQSVYAADIDGDGDSDVLSASFRDDKVAWYQNGDSSGGGNGSSWATIEITTTFNRPVSLYAADIDGDGDQDVLPGSQYNETLALYENTRVTTSDPVVYVDVDVEGGAEDGSSWSDAYPNLQDAITNVPSGPVNIWVAAGTYRPDEGDEPTQGDRAASFTIPNFVQVYGGFDGTDRSGGGARETSRNERDPDPATNGTVLSGDLGTADFPNDNSYHVATVTSDADAVLDGFTIRDGNANAIAPDNSGAGIWVKSGSNLTLRNARLLDNSASGSGGDGGGLFSEGDFTMESVTASNNAADRGGGIYSTTGNKTLTSVTANSNTGAGIWVDGGENTLTDVAANDNTKRGIRADGRGNTFTDVVAGRNDNGGIRSEGTFTNVTVKNDTASGYGGGIHLTGPSTLSQVTISENKTTRSGGGLYSDGYDVDLSEVTLAENAADENGGGVYVRNATLRAVNISLYGNEQTSSASDGGGLHLSNVSGILTNVVLSGNAAAGDGGALYISPDGNVPLTNITAVNNSASGEGGALYTTSSNSNDFPSLRNTILWGNTATSSGSEKQAFIASGDMPVEHSLIEGGVPNGAFDGGNNLDEDPQFANSRGEDGTIGTTDDDLRLQGPGSGGGASPAIEAGDSGLLPDDVLDVDDDGDTSESLPLDRVGNTREMDVSEVSGSSVDMGVYESSGDPLPVELVTFDATHQSEAAVLTWQTASERNNAGFDVQRRVSGEWETLSFVEGTGTTSETQTYRFRDTDLPYETESVKYRLKQVDTDGTTSFSDTQTLKIGAPDKFVLHAPFPNPTKEQATLRYSLPRKTDVSIRIYDVLGRQVETIRRGTEDAGRKEIPISTSRLSPGTYFVRMQAGEKMKTKQLTVVR